jgi:hypothetical protein
MLVSAQCSDPLRPRLRGAVAEPKLRTVQRDGPAGLIEPARQVAAVEQRDPEPGLRGRVDQRSAHRIRVGVRGTAWRVMQVVELAHAADPGQRHLCVDGAGERQVTAGIERAGDLIHPLAPRPERAPARLRDPAQGAVECVRVRVREPWHGQPCQPHRPGRQCRCCRPRRDLAEPVIRSLDAHVGQHADAGQPGEF